jgi:hypothetical protein
MLMCAEGGTRTLTLLKASDFKSDVSTISPLRRDVVKSDAPSSGTTGDYTCSLYFR